MEKRRPKNNSRVKGFQCNRQSRGKKKQHQHFPPLDLCDSITLNILSPEQARLPSNRCSQPLMRLARGQPELPALLIARLKSLYLIGPETQKEIIPRGCLSEKKNNKLVLLTIKNNRDVVAKAPPPPGGPLPDTDELVQRESWPPR